MTPKSKSILKHIVLFLLTLTTTTLAGAEWQFSRFLFFEENPLTWEYFLKGFAFSLPLLGFLTVHEFGHYFTARWHKVRVSLPYYIPLWFGFIGLPTIGTGGAVIRIRDFVKSRQKYFDIGIAGPLAGFVVALAVLFYGFTHLPPPEYIFEIHPEYEEYGLDYADHVYDDQSGSFRMGTSLLFEFFKEYVATQPERVPNPYEIIHYPWLFAGFLALFFTALNLIPIGQLDGGHVLYGLVGSRWHRWISPALFIVFVFYAGLGTITPYEPTEDLLLTLPLYLGFLYVVFSRMSDSFLTNLMIAVCVLSVQFTIGSINPTIRGYPGWLVFGFLLGRVLGIYHPPVMMDRPLSPFRKLLGWLALIVFILCFSPQPFIVEV
jgi:membrane-associated protease RseP (regulator of RpoE activity)